MKYEIREVIGYENLYMVDTEGNVFSVRNDGLKVLKPEKNNDGYLRVKLYKYNVCKRFFVHRLVLSTFCPNENSDKLTVNHKDEDKTNNNLENLEWMTAKENVVYSQAHPVVQLDKNDNLIGVYESISDAARQVNGDTGRICDCIKGERKTHKNSKWILYEDYFKMTIINKGKDLIN